jgi:hypothetical protein
MPIPADPKNDREPGKRPVVFQRCSPCFLSVVWFGRKLSKSLMPLSNCPFGLNRRSLFFLENLPVFEKSGGPAQILCAVARAGVAAANAADNRNSDRSSSVMLPPFLVLPAAPG